MRWIRAAASSPSSASSVTPPGTSTPFPARHYGARFAAKEAVSKAFGTGIGSRIGWRDIEVKRKETGEPFILLHGSAADLAGTLHVLQALVSLSHSDCYAVANAVLIAGH